MTDQQRRHYQARGSTIAAAAVAVVTVLATVAVRIIEPHLTGAVFGIGMLSAAVALATTLFSDT